MRRTLLTTFVLCSACSISDLPSNLPDGGSCATPSGTDAGGATLTGGRAFVVASGYQVSQVVDGQQRLSFALYEAPTTCAQVQAPTEDGGQSGTLRLGDLTVTVFAGSDAGIGLGRVGIGYTGDGGYAAVDRIVRTNATDGGAQARFFLAKAGWVELETLEACSAAGRFSAELDEGDGGVSTLEGQFGAPYCATRR